MQVPRVCLPLGRYAMVSRYVKRPLGVLVGLGYYSRVTVEFLPSRIEKMRSVNG